MVKNIFYPNLVFDRKGQAQHNVHEVNEEK